MSDAARLHDEQIAYWNGTGGRHWAEQQARTDRVMAPVARLAIDRAAPTPGETVLDVGCGAGVSSAELAARVGPGGRVVAVDVSAPLLELARQRYRSVATLEFRLADAAEAPLDGIAADLNFSRFGVMFFGDPAAAFANLRRGQRPGGRLVFACWRKPTLNPVLMLPLQAAYLHVPRLPQLGPEDPGPFSFADPDRVRRILDAAGYRDIELEPADLTLDIAAGGGLAEALVFATEIGAASRAIEGQPDELRRAAVGAIEAALAEVAVGDTVPLPAAIWLVAARAP
jgi:ubiquinone/menaquinone biosynthesis C-methylase UbiE